MKYSIPAIEEYEKLLPVARQIYDHTSNLSWQMLLPLFLVSVAVGYTTDLGVSGSILVRLKRLIIVAILLVSFPMIAEFSQILGVEVARSIDDMTGIDMVLDAASKRADSYSFDLQGLLNLGSDLLIGSLVIVSFVILIVARFFLLAFQHFYWFLLVALGPFLILGTLFESSSGITRGLFKSMFQVACWPVIWSILSAFLKALPFASAYAVEGNLITVVTLNLIIAVALLFSPFIISQLADGVNLSIGNTLKNGVLKTVMMANPKTAAASFGMKGARYANHAKNFTKGGR
ncbi:MAG: hypothetical protein ACK5WZ_06980 [Pseudobdellovibrionaceae bacterium]